MKRNTVLMNLAAAQAIPADQVQSPVIPVPVFVEETMTATVAAAEHLAEFEAVGMPVALIATVEQRAIALQSAQAIWNAGKSKVRDENNIKIYERADQLVSDTLAAGDLALRDDAEGKKRLEAIRQGTGLADRVADLTDLSVLVTDEREKFAAIHMPVDARAAELADVAKTLQKLLAEEDAAKTNGTGKEMRDRFYTLVLEPLDELRAFARYAFRNDSSDRRRNAFGSSYARRNARAAYRRRKNADSTTASAPVVESIGQ